MRDGSAAPLVLLATLPSALQVRLDRLRATHYPADRNRVPAHCTLLRTLPPSAESEVHHTLAVLAGELAPLPAQLSGVMDLGGGTALGLVSSELLALHSQLIDLWHGLLTPADRGVPRFHITIQNKVDPQAARHLQRKLETSLVPERFAIPGLTLVRYRDGLWAPAGSWRFRRAR